MKTDKNHGVSTNEIPDGRESPNAREGWRSTVDSVLVKVILPLGTFAFLTGMFWIVDHGLYSKLFYWLIALPSLLLLATQPRSVAHMFGSRIVIAYVLFACYMSLTIFWSGTSDNAIDLVKRPLYVFLFFYFIFEFGRRRSDLLHNTVMISAVFAIAAGLFTVGRFFIEGASGRLAGYGALSNPLMVSHVFGFFVALWLGTYFSGRKLFEPLSGFAMLVGVVLLFATGSRTPLVALVVTSLWLSVLTFNRKGVVVLGLLASLFVAIAVLAPDLILQRGLSYRTEIWADVLQKISEKVWFGYGYNAPLKIQLDAFPYPFSDPHNLTLAVFHAGGILGLVLWLWLYFNALLDGWRFRADKWVLMLSAAVVYGLAAGMTEGGSFLPRPKEHWFLIWIPMALLAEAVYGSRVNVRGK